MRFLKALSLLAALLLLGGAVLDAQTGLLRQALGAAPDAGARKAANDDTYLHATKAAPLFVPHREPKQMVEDSKRALDAGK